MKALKLSLTYEPPQIGLLYKRHENDKKKQVYLIQLNGLIFLGDPEKITELLYEKHSGFLAPHVVPRKQIQKFVERLLMYLQQQIAAYERDQKLNEEEANNPWTDQDEYPDEEIDYNQIDSD